MTRQIESMQDLCDYFYADEPARLNRHIYKYTDCGASISVYLARPGVDPWGREEEHHAIHNGSEEWASLTTDTAIHSFTIQTIVEGSDATVDSLPFVLPVEASEVDKWMQYMEDEAEMLWREANEYEEEAEDLED